MQNYTLFELNERIRRVIALNWTEAVWVTAEIAQLSQSRGHYYLTLVQKKEETDTILAQMEALLWQNTLRQLKRTLSFEMHQLLQEGTEVLIKVRPDFHERYGLKLQIEDIDPSFTLGKLELKRQQILEALKELKLLDRNQGHTLPLVLQNLAILSSPQAAGLQDFNQQLLQNTYGYHFNTSLYPIVVQGDQVEKELLAALKKIEKKAADFDAVLIIRGGGNKLDLAAFDNLAIAKAIATFPIPFISGIGHDINQTVVDQVAHTSLKTPTAVADFLINHNLQFEFSLNQLALVLKNSSQSILQTAAHQLLTLDKKLEFHSKQMVIDQKRLINYMEEEIPKLSTFQLKTAQQKIEELEKVQQLLSPEATLKRGYTITLRDNEILSSANKINKGDKISTRFKDGTIDSEVE